MSRGDPPEVRLPPVDQLAEALRRPGAAKALLRLIESLDDDEDDLAGDGSENPTLAPPAPENEAAPGVDVPGLSHCPNPKESASAPNGERNLRCPQ